MGKGTAVITGASSGIGHDLARLMAADGYDLILTARRGNLLRQLAAELVESHGVKVEVIEMDLSVPGAAGKLWMGIAAVTSDLDILVNNAGIGDASEFFEEEHERIEAMIHLNVLALSLLTRYALAGMKAKNKGKIMNVASIAGFQPGGPGMAVYYATKSFVLSLTRGIRRELARSAVTVTALCPGPTRTEFESTADANKTRLFKILKPMDVKDVAEIGYRGMQAGKGVVVPGILNKLLSFGGMFSPPSVSIEINRFLLSKAD